MQLKLRVTFTGSTVCTSALPGTVTAKVTCELPAVPTVELRKLPVRGGARPETALGDQLRFCPLWEDPVARR